MFINAFIGNYLRNLTLEKALLIAEQFNVDFTRTEMAIALPFIKENYLFLLDETSRIYYINELAKISNPQIAKKVSIMIEKLLIIMSQ